MTIYLGRVIRSQSDYAWIKPIAMAESGDYGWRQNANEDDFPSRGTVHAPKGSSDGLNEDTMWVFELQENPYFADKPSGAKYSAVKLQPAYVLLDLEYLANQEMLRQALLRGVSSLPVSGADHCHWLLRSADGIAIQLAPDQIKANRLSDGQISLMLSQTSLNGSLDVTGCRPASLPKGSIFLPYYHPDWLPHQKEVHCWDSDARFMERMVNRMPKLKRRCEQAGLSLSKANEISKAKAREALEILELSGTLSGSNTLEQAQFDRLKDLLESIDQNQYLAEKLFKLVYDNEALEKYLNQKEQEYLQIRQHEIKQQLTAKLDKLEILQAKIDQAKTEHDIIKHQIEETEGDLEKLNLQAEQDINDRKQILIQEFDQFKQDLLKQSQSVQEQFSTKLAETLMQRSLLQLVSPSTGLAASDEYLIQPSVRAEISAESTLMTVEGINDSQKWQEDLTCWADLFHLDPDAMYLADVITRSREIAMLQGDNATWLAQCYASMFGHQQILRYTPGPTTLSLEDLFFRGGTGAPTQFQTWVNKAISQPEHVHLVLIEQVYCEQAHLWLPSLAREMRYGNRIPQNMLVLMCASETSEKLDKSAIEAIWPIDCGSAAALRTATVEDPKAIALETSGLDVGLVCPGKQLKLIKTTGFSVLQQNLRSTHEHSPETWNRFYKILTTTVHFDERRLHYTGQYLLKHLQAAS